MCAKSKAPTNSVCLNHPDWAAVSRCTTCFKPICGACIVRSQGEDFCSEQCKANYESSRPRVEEFQERENRRRAARRRRRLVILIVLAVAAYFAYRQYRANPNTVQELKQKAEETRRTVEQKARQLVK